MDKEARIRAIEEQRQREKEEALTAFIKSLPPQMWRVGLK